MKSSINKRFLVNCLNIFLKISRRLIGESKEDELFGRLKIFRECKCPGTTKIRSGGSGKLTIMFTLLVHSQFGFYSNSMHLHHLGSQKELHFSTLKNGCWVCNFTYSYSKGMNVDCLGVGMSIYLQLGDESNLELCGEDWVFCCCAIQSL